MKITLIRHSKTLQDPNIRPTQWGLSDEGILLAHELSKETPITDVSVFYSSLQTKALETAVLLAKPHGIPIQTDDDLTEVTSFTLRHLGKEKYEEYAAAMYAGTLLRIEDGESLEEALTRFSKAIERIVEVEGEKGNGNIGIVSHSNVLSLFTAQYCDSSAFDLHNSILMPDVAVLDLETREFARFWGDAF